MENPNEMPKEEIIRENDLTLQKFLTDMSALGKQINNPDIQKPAFHYGDLSITNYLLWLMLGELMILNDRGGQ